MRRDLCQFYSGVRDTYEVDGCLVDLLPTPGEIDRLLLSSFRTIEADGNANVFMRRLCGLADKHGVTLWAHASPFGHYRLPTVKLLRWYGYWGFKNLGIESLASGVRVNRIERTPRPYSP